MKIQDYVLASIEAKVLTYCISKSPDVVLQPQLEMWGRGAPATYKPGKREVLPLGKVYISDCRPDSLTANNKKYYIVIAAHRAAFRTLGHHMELVTALSPWAKKMRCRIESNFLKCSFKCEKTLITFTVD